MRQGRHAPQFFRYFLCQRDSVASSTPSGRLGASDEWKVLEEKVPEVMRLIEQMEGISKLMAQLIYGAGLRLSERCRLREGCGPPSDALVGSKRRRRVTGRRSSSPE